MCKVQLRGYPMADTVDFDGLYELAQHQFRLLIKELAHYGVIVETEPELRRTNGLLSYYDRQSGHIYVAIPDFSTAMGVMEKWFISSLLGCEEDKELLFLLRLWIPYVITHEFAHYLRDRYGQF